ncbi:MAG: DUF1961 family protein [Melioribacteraceae bacterium]
MKQLEITILIFSFIILQSCKQHVKENISSDNEQKILHQEDFSSSSIPNDLFIEGSKKVVIRDGHLWVDAVADSIGESNVSTIWLNKEFSGDLKVEFDASVIQSPGDQNNINFFFLYSDPSGKSLFESSDLRKDGSYKTYHNLNGYIFTYLANGNPDTARFRFRDCPGFNLLKENNTYHCIKDSIYRIEIIKKGNSLTYSVDGKTYLDIKDYANPIHSKGIIGFRTWKTELWWDNLIVTQL